MRITGAHGIEDIPRRQACLTGITVRQTADTGLKDTFSPVNEEARQIYGNSGRLPGDSAVRVKDPAQSTFEKISRDTDDLAEMAKRLNELLQGGTISDDIHTEVRDKLKGLAEQRDASIREAFKKAYNVLLGDEDSEGDFLDDVDEHLDALEGKETVRESEQEKDPKLKEKKEEDADIEAKKRIISVGTY